MQQLSLRLVYDSEMIVPPLLVLFRLPLCADERRIL
mgnify:FL=1